MGIRVPRDLPAFLQGNVQGNVKVMIAEVMAKAKGTFGKQPDVVFFLLHAASTALYKAIKDCCDVQFGIASQGRSIAIDRDGADHADSISDACRQSHEPEGTAAVSWKYRIEGQRQAGRLKLDNHRTRLQGTSLHDHGR